VDSNDGTTPLPSQAQPVDTSRAGNCLAIGSFDGAYAFSVITYDCSSAIEFVCQYVNGV
jgi:hypothetical protein